MRLTLDRAKRFTLDAAHRAGLEIRITDAEWLGQRSRERFGSAFFRVARVTVTDGRHVARKLVTIDTDGGALVQ